MIFVLSLLSRRYVPKTRKKELAYFGIDQRHRLSAKIAIDVGIYSIVPLMSVLIVEGVQQYGGLHAAEPIFITTMIVGLGGLYYIHRIKIKNFC